MTIHTSQSPVVFVRMPSMGQRKFATLSGLMNKMNANFLDLEEATSDIAEDEIFIAGDGHINTEGHQRVADALANWIQNRN